MRKFFESLEARVLFSVSQVSGVEADFQPLHLDEEMPSEPLNVQAESRPTQTQAPWLGASDPEFFVPHRPN